MIRGQKTMLAFATICSLTACHPARQTPEMDANNLSDDRGARAGRFLSPPDNSSSVENSQ